MLPYSVTVVVTALVCILKSSDGINIKPAEQEIFSYQLCPNPMTKGPSSGIFAYNKIMPIKLDKDWRSYERFLPCNFKEDTGQSSNASTVRVRSINLNVESWNFSTANRCENFIKFKDAGEYGDGFQVMCGRENFDQYLGPYGHPMVLYYRWETRGLSFPLFHSSYGPHFRDRKDTMELKYMQIYFAIFSNRTWNCRVQQYKLDLMKMGCPAVYEPESICGDYSCSDLEFLYQRKMTVFKEGEADKILVWKSKTSDKYRMRTFLRQKFVPIVFLVVLVFAYKSYMKAGFRLQGPAPITAAELRSRRIPRNFPSRPYCSRGLRQTYWEYGEPIPGMPSPYGIDAAVSPVDPVSSCAVTNRPKTCDPPPSYESLCPPSYSEATKK